MPCNQILSVHIDFNLQLDIATEGGKAITSMLEASGTVSFCKVKRSLLVSTTLALFAEIRPLLFRRFRRLGYTNTF
jgi:hypothetical protein